MQNDRERQGGETRQDGNWREVFEGNDKNAFHDLAERYTPDLIEAARRGLEFYIRQDEIHSDDFTAEEVAGQALIYAWEHRSQCPPGMSLRGWLLGTEYRVLRGMAESQRAYRNEKRISLDEPLTPNEASFDSQEWFWEWYQPDAMLLWEDALADTSPRDVEIDLDDEKDVAVDRDSDARHALMLHDEFELTLPEVAFAMGRSLNDLAELLQQPRRSIREQLPAEPHITEADQPAPPEGSDQ